GFRKRSQGSPWAAELPLDFVERAGLLEGTQRADRGVEQSQQDQQAVVVVVPGAVVGGVAGTADLVQTRDQGDQAVEVLKPGQFLSRILRFLGAHGAPPASWTVISAGKSMAQIPCRTDVGTFLIMTCGCHN